MGSRGLHLSDRGSYESHGERLLAFFRENNIKVLNVAGSRGSKERGVAGAIQRTPLAADKPDRRLGRLADWDRRIAQ